MVVAAGEHWPEGWVKGAGFVRQHAAVDVTVPPRSVEEVGLEYVGQIVDCSPGQRSRYRGQLRVLKAVEVQGQRGPYRPFDERIQAATEDDIKVWLIRWKRSLKTKANYHGLLHGVFNYALEKEEVARNPLLVHRPEAQQDQAVPARLAVPHRARVFYYGRGGQG